MVRTFHPKKSAWARAKAEDARQRAFALPTERSSDWRRHADRASTLDYLLAEAARFERVAASLERRGL